MFGLDTVEMWSNFDADEAKSDSFDLAHRLSLLHKLLVLNSTQYCTKQQSYEEAVTDTSYEYVDHVLL